MRGDRREDHAGKQDRLRGLLHPDGGGSCKIGPVAMFEQENKAPAVFLIEQGRAAPGPWPRNGNAVVTLNRMPRIFARKWRSAAVADKASHKGGFPPARPAETEIRGDMRITTEALRRVDGPERGLQSHWFPPKVRNMPNHQTLTDRAALIRNRIRAARAPVLFLQDDAADEVQERLVEVNRSFTSPAVVTAFPDLWQKRMPDARIITDDEVLDLEPAAHDLVIHALCLHWANDLVGQLVQSRRALRPDGLFLGVLFGGQTLSELRSCLAEAEVSVSGGLSPRILPMSEIRDLGGLLQRAGFALPVADSVKRRVTYRDAFHLMGDLRSMGEGNALSARLRRPTQRKVFAEAARRYADGFSDHDGRVRAEFELIFLTGWAPHESQPKPLRPGTATRRLSEALGVPETPLGKVPDA